MGAVPVRLTTDPAIYARSAIIEVAQAATGKVYIAFSEADATTTNRHTLDKKGDIFVIEPTEYGNLDAYFLLRDVWLHGSTPGDKVIVSYVEFREPFE